jgi:hypothetical protein
MQVRGETVDQGIHTARDGKDHVVSVHQYWDPIDGDHRRVKSCPCLGETLYQVRMSVELVLVNVNCRISRFRWFRLALEELQHFAVGLNFGIVRQAFHGATSNEGDCPVRLSRAPFNYQRLLV